LGCGASNRVNGGKIEGLNVWNSGAPGTVGVTWENLSYCRVVDVGISGFQVGLSVVADGGACMRNVFEGFSIGGPLDASGNPLPGTAGIQWQILAEPSNQNPCCNFNTFRDGGIADCGTALLMSRSQVGGFHTLLWERCDFEGNTATLACSGANPCSAKFADCYWEAQATASTCNAVGSYLNFVDCTGQPPTLPMEWIVTTAGAGNWWSTSTPGTPSVSGVKHKGLDKRPAGK
jgi:hypothetical protein